MDETPDSALSRLQAELAGSERAVASLEAAFGRAGKAMERELLSVARTGEADLERLARALVETLARLAASQGQAAGGASPNVVMNFMGNPSSEAITGSSNQIAALVARAVRRGARWL